MAIVTSDSETDWNAARNGKVTNNSNNSTQAATKTVTELTDSAKALRQKYDEARTYVSQTYGERPAKATLQRRNDLALDYDIREEYNERQPNNRFVPAQRLTIEDDFDTPTTNDKGYTFASWNTAVNKYCTSKGLESTYVVNGGYPTAANVTTTRTITDTTTVKTPSTSTTIVDEDKQTKATFSFDFFFLLTCGLTCGVEKSILLTISLAVKVLLLPSSYK